MPIFESEQVLTRMHPVSLTTAAPDMQLETLRLYVAAVQFNGLLLVGNLELVALDPIK
jgi:hypothetical protein